MKKALLQIAIAAVWILVLASCVAVVWSKDQSRSLFIELQKLQAQRDDLDTEWGQLKLEQSAWATYGRVEQMAHEDLQMVIPRPDKVQIVQP